MLLAACGDNLQERPDAAPVPPPDAATCDQVQGEPALGLQLVAAGLEEPVEVTAAPGDPRVFVVEKQGRVRIVAPGDVLLEAPFLALDDVAIDGEAGLLAIAFHPQYAANGRLFITYARTSDHALVVEEWLVDPVDPDRADPASRRPLLAVPHTQEFHYGSMLAFGADGMLYVSTGDGGPQRDPEHHGQDLASLRAKMLRIDVDHGDPYAIPDDNPFGTEIWAYGLRNPWRFAIDPVTQAIYIGDVGLDSAEEIDVIPAQTGGLDFGWSILEGEECLDPNDCDPTGLVAPAHLYSHALGCAIIGGPVYRGCRMPGHDGTLFYGDFCGGWLRSWRPSDGATGFYPLVQVVTLSAIGADAAGELYVADFDAGEVSRIVPVE